MRVNYNSVLIFCRTKHGADRIAGLLKRNNHAVAVLHSNRTQREREQALRGFRDGRFEVLVATDIAARGLDIADVSHVINYDVPQHPEDYIHRIGRTGRAEAQRRRLHHHDRRGCQPRLRHRTLHQPENPAREAGKFRLQIHHAVRGRTNPASRKGFPGKARGVRVHGGYHFAPGRRR